MRICFHGDSMKLPNNEDISFFNCGDFLGGFTSSFKDACSMQFISVHLKSLRKEHGQVSVRTMSTRQ